MGEYFPYWCHDKGRKYKNPLFDDYSNQILNLKNRERSAIVYFSELLVPLANRNTAIVVVPSHDPEKKDSGIHDLAKFMSERGLWIDACDCLLRTIKTPKAAYGGSRSVHVHLSSITVVNAEIIKGRSIFLLDDVRTTGNTLMACRMLLERAGARSVKTYALGEAYLERS